MRTQVLSPACVRHLSVNLIWVNISMLPIRYHDYVERILYYSRPVLPKFSIYDRGG